MKRNKTLHNVVPEMYNLNFPLLSDDKFYLFFSHMNVIWSLTIFNFQRLLTQTYTIWKVWKRQVFLNNIYTEKCQLLSKYVIQVRYIKGIQDCYLPKFY